MAKRRLKSPTTGKMVDAELVEISSISELPIRIVLADGSKLRLKTDVIEVARFDGEWDKDGHPLYSVRSASIMVVLESPDHLRKAAAKKLDG